MLKITNTPGPARHIEADQLVEWRGAHITIPVAQRLVRALCPEPQRAFDEPGDRYNQARTTLMLARNILIQVKAVGAN